MFTDIVGYTALMGNDEQKAFSILNKNRALQKPIIEQFNGRYVAAEYFEKAIEKREAGILYTKDGIRLIDEKMYVSQIEKVLEKVEAFKRKIN